jgi:hypothetical protein
MKYLPHELIELLLCFVRSLKGTLTPTELYSAGADVCLWFQNGLTKAFLWSECSDGFLCFFSAGHKTLLKRLNDSHASVLHDIRCIVICGEVLFVCCDVFCMGCVGIKNSSHKTHVQKRQLIFFSEFVPDSHSLIPPLVWFANVETLLIIFGKYIDSLVTNQNSQIPYPKQYPIQNLLTRHVKAS